MLACSDNLTNKDRSFHAKGQSICGKISPHHYPPILFFISLLPLLLFLPSEISFFTQGKGRGWSWTTRLDPPMIIVIQLAFFPLQHAHSLANSLLHDI